MRRFVVIVSFSAALVAAAVQAAPKGKVTQADLDKCQADLTSAQKAVEDLKASANKSGDQLKSENANLQKQVSEMRGENEKLKNSIGARTEKLLDGMEKHDKPGAQAAFKEAKAVMDLSTPGHPAYELAEMFKEMLDKALKAGDFTYQDLSDEAQ